jgi:DNA-binding PadR family transcriptional regulator
MPDHPNDWRRALKLLASLEEGSTVARLLARGFSSATIAGLVEAGLVSATIERALAGQRTIVVRRFRITDRGRATLGTMTRAIDRFVLKMQLRKALGVIKGLRRHVSDQDEDVIVLKLLEELDVAGYEIIKKPGSAGFTFETPGGDGAA